MDKREPPRSWLVGALAPAITGACIVALAGLVAFLTAQPWDGRPSPTDDESQPAIFVQSLPPPPDSGSIPEGGRVMVPMRHRFPEFSTWTQVLEYVDHRHSKVRAFAEKSPDDSLWALVTTKGLDRDDMVYLVTTYGLTSSSADAFTGQHHVGGLSIPPDRIGEQITPGMTVTSFSGTGRASDWVRLIDEESARIVVVDANANIDRLEGKLPEYISLWPAPSIYADYVKFSPERDGGAVDEPPLDTPPPAAGNYSEEELELRADMNGWAHALFTGDLLRMWGDFIPAACRAKTSREEVAARAESFDLGQMLRLRYPPATYEILLPEDINIDGDSATFDFGMVDRAEGYPEKREIERGSAVREDGHWRLAEGFFDGTCLPPATRSTE